MQELTTKDHWDAAWGKPPRWRLPSSLVVGTRNIQRVLRRNVRPGMRVLELGCAPGKILAWVAADLDADVSGLDYSEHGIAWSRHLFQTLNIHADLRCEDVLRTSFPAGTYDLAYSWGLVEHFTDPRPVVGAHVRLLRPGGKAIIGIPHYGGVYGRLQRWFDPQNLAVHNLNIMTPEDLVALAPPGLSEGVHAYPAGRMSPWLISFGRRWPQPVAQGLNHALNGLALLQPADIPAICPLLVLEITRRGGDTTC